MGWRGTNQPIQSSVRPRQQPAASPAGLLLPRSQSSLTPSLSLSLSLSITLHCRGDPAIVYLDGVKPPSPSSPTALLPSTEHCGKKDLDQQIRSVSTNHTMYQLPTTNYQSPPI